MEEEADEEEDEEEVESDDLDQYEIEGMELENQEGELDMDNVVENNIDLEYGDEDEDLE